MSGQAKVFKIDAEGHVTTPGVSHTVAGLHAKLDAIAASIEEMRDHDSERWVWLKACLQLMADDNLDRFQAAYKRMDEKFPAVLEAIPTEEIIETHLRVGRIESELYLHTRKPRRKPKKGRR